jgi:hypothetical protein
VTRLLYTVGLLQSLLVGGGALGTVVSSDTGCFVPAYFGSFGAEDAAQSTLTACADAVLLSGTGTTTATATAGTGSTAAAASAAAGTAAGADVYSYADDDADGCCADYASQSSDVAAVVAAAPPQLQGLLALLVARVVAVGHALAAASRASTSSTAVDSSAVHRDPTDQGNALRVSEGSRIPCPRTLKWPCSFVLLYRVPCVFVRVCDSCAEH